MHAAQPTCRSQNNDWLQPMYGACMAACIQRRHQLDNFNSRIKLCSCPMHTQPTNDKTHNPTLSSVTAPQHLTSMQRANDALQVRDVSHVHAVLTVLRLHGLVLGPHQVLQVHVDGHLHTPPHVTAAQGDIRLAGMLTPTSSRCRHTVSSVNLLASRQRPSHIWHKCLRRPRKFEITVRRLLLQLQVMTVTSCQNTHHAGHCLCSAMHARPVTA